MSSQGQVTLSKSLRQRLGNPTHFEAELEGGKGRERLVLRPAMKTTAATWERLFQEEAIAREDLLEAMMIVARRRQGRGVDYLPIAGWRREGKWGSAGVMGRFGIPLRVGSGLPHVVGPAGALMQAEVATVAAGVVLSFPNWAAKLTQLARAGIDGCLRIMTRRPLLKYWASASCGGRKALPRVPPSQPRRQSDPSHQRAPARRT